MNAWKLAQLETLRTADNWGKEWTLSELDLVATTMDEPVRDVADVLERSLYAVSTVRGKLLSGWQQTNGRSRKRLAEVKVCATCWTQVTPAGTCCC